VFERFTDRARRVVTLAQVESKGLNHGYIGTEHILLGLISEGEGVAAKALKSLDISLDAVRYQIVDIIGKGQQPPTGHIPFTPRAKKALELALREALQLGHNYIGTEHILLGLIREREGVAAQVLMKLGADLNRVRQQVIQLLAGYAGKEVVDFGPVSNYVPLGRLAVGIDMLESSVELSLEEQNGESREICEATVRVRDSNGATVKIRFTRQDIASIGEDGFQKSYKRSAVTVTARRSAMGLVLLVDAPNDLTYTIIGASLSYDSNNGEICQYGRALPLHRQKE
jgi:ATP-dependent Clp protease ATP-binding subunit ClpA